MICSDVVAMARVWLERNYMVTRATTTFDRVPHRSMPDPDHGWRILKGSPGIFFVEQGAQINCGHSMIRWPLQATRFALPEQEKSLVSIAGRSVLSKPNWEIANVNAHQ